MILVDAWKVFSEAWKDQRALEHKRKQFQTFNQKNLNYTLIEEMVKAASSQRPGFYSKLVFPDGTTWEFGVKLPPVQIEGSTF